MQFSTLLSLLTLAALPLPSAAVYCATTAVSTPVQACTSPDTNRCPVRKTYPQGSNVNVACYLVGEVVQNDSMWFRLGGVDYPLVVAAAYVRNCYGIRPC